MANYYFLAASCPPLTFKDRPELSFEELRGRLEINLSKRDLEMAKIFALFIDINNIRALYLEEPIDTRGNLSEKELDEALLLKDILPAYVFEFLERFQNVAERIKNFYGLLSRFFLEEIPKWKGFLHRYLVFEKEWRLVLTALRAKQLKRDVVRELQFEDFSDPLVAQIIAQKDASQYDPPIEYRDLKDLLLTCGSDPKLQGKVFAEWRFHRIEEMVERPLFSIDWILSYMAKLLIVEQWHELDENKGIMILDTFKVIA